MDHRLRWLHVAFVVRAEEPAGFFDGGLVAEAGEYVEQLALIRLSVAGAVGGYERETGRTRQLDGALVARFFVAKEVALQFGVDVARAEDRGEPVDALAAGALLDRFGERAALVAGEADQAFGELGEVVHGRGGLAFRRVELHLGDQAAEVAVAGFALGQQRIAGAVDGGDLGSDVGADAALLRLFVEANDAGEAVAVEHRDAGLVERGACVGDLFGE